MRNKFFLLSPKILIIAILIIGFALRTLFFESSTFIYDQARDAFTAMSIWHGDPIKIIGPPTDIVGLSHGPLYWYLISPALILSGGNILYVKILLILINLAAVFFIYDLSKDLFKNKTISLLSAFLYAISYEAVSYGRWISNPAPALVTTAISFWSLNKLINGKKWAIITLFVSWGLSIQFEFFMVYQIFVFTAIWLASMGPKMPKISKKIFLMTVLGYLATVSTFILSELKFNFQGIRALFGFLKTQTALGGSFTSMFISYIDRLVVTFYLNVWGINLFMAGLLAIMLIFLSFQNIKNNVHRKEFLFLIIWAISPIIVNFFAGPNATFISLGALIPVIIIAAYFILSLSKNWKMVMYTAIALIVFANFNFVLTNNKHGDVIFAVQKRMILSDELKVIDWIYSEANHQPYKLNTITQPIFINSTWAYLFNWYGRSKYGYMPIWWGETQVDVPGADVKYTQNGPAKLEFLIIEPTAGGDDYYIKAVKVLENSRSKTIKTQHIGNFTVEEREITREFTFTSGDVFRVIKGTDLLELQKVQ